MKGLWLAALLAGGVLGQSPSAIEPAKLGAAPNVTQAGGKLYFAGQPDEAALKEAAERGVKAVINLRTPEEMAQVKFDEPKLAADSGMSYLAVPMQQRAPSQPELDKIFTLLDEAQKPDGKPVFLHCASSNRVGFVWGLYQASRRNLNAEDAVAQAKAAGMKSPALEKALREQLATK